MVEQRQVFIPPCIYLAPWSLAIVCCVIIKNIVLLSYSTQHNPSKTAKSRPYQTQSKPARESTQPMDNSDIRQPSFGRVNDVTPRVAIRPQTRTYRWHARPLRPPEVVAQRAQTGNRTMHFRFRSPDRKHKTVVKLCCSMAAAGNASTAHLSVTDITSRSRKFYNGQPLSANVKYQ